MNCASCWPLWPDNAELLNRRHGCNKGCFFPKNPVMNGPESPGNICPKCGAHLPAGAPEGLCPACLLAMNLAAPTELPDALGPHGTRVERPPLLPPRPEEIAH